jgi:CBS domain-containing protein
LQVQQIMTREPACCGPDTPLNEVAKLMVRYATTSIPVVGNPELRSPLLGLLTDRDIVCRVLAEDRNPLERTAKDCMTRPSVILRLEQDVADAARLMDRERARRVPVIDNNGRLCGIVTHAQLARAREKETSYEVAPRGR